MNRCLVSLTIINYQEDKVTEKFILNKVFELFNEKFSYKKVGDLMNSHCYCLANQILHFCSLGKLDQ